MRKLLMLLFAAFFLSAPALVIYYSMKTSAATMQAENEKQLLHRMQNELQRQDMLTNPVTEIYRKLFMALRQTKDDVYSSREENEVNDELLGFISGLMRETTSMWFGGEAAMIYRKDGKDNSLTIRDGKNAPSGALEPLMVMLRTAQMSRGIKTVLQETEKVIGDYLQTNLRLYFSLKILSEDGDGDKIQRAVIREAGSYRLLMLLRLRAAFILNFLTDLTSVDEDAKAKHKIAGWRLNDMGLALFNNRKPGKVAASSFFISRQALLAQTSRLLATSGECSGIFRWQNYLLLVSTSDPKKPHRTVIAARVPDLQQQPMLMLLTVVFGILGCFIFKVVVESIVFERGSDISIMKFILAIFVLVTMLPLLSSAYLANEYVAANFKREKNRSVKELADELMSLDVTTLANFRVAVNTARSLDSVEKLARLAQMPESTPINILLLQSLQKLQKIHGRPFFTNVWVYDEVQPFFSVIYDREKSKYRFTAGGNAVAEEMFLNKYKAYMKQQSPETGGQSGKQQTDNIEFDALKAELLDSFFLNMFGDKTYYKLREDFGSLIWQESFMDTNALLTTPIALKGRPRYIFTWVFESVGIRDHFPNKKLRTDRNQPLFAIFGNDLYIGARPTGLPELNHNFPALVELGNQSLISGSRMFMQDCTASGSPVFEARPARHSDLIMCGSRYTRDLESITNELMAEALRYFAWIAVCGIMLAFLTSLYFTIPIRQLTQATLQIAEGNYEVRLDQRHPDEFAVAATTFNKMVIGLQQGELLSSFVSESVKELATREQLTSSDIAQNTSITVLFSCVRDFASIQQQHTPQQIFEILQAHLSTAVEAVAEYGGEIDKMIEDKVMIVFDSRQQDETGQVNAAASVALSIRQTMRETYSLTTAAGITTGEVVAGVMGASTVRLSKTVVGDTVNLAARLAAIAAGFPEGGIVAAESSTRKLSAAYQCQKLPISQVKGKTRTVEAYSVTRETV